MLVILMISSCATGHIEKSKKLHGFYIENDYVSPGNAFKIKLDKNSIVTDTEANVTITHEFLGSIRGWDDVAFVKPELTVGKKPQIIMQSLINDIALSIYKKPSIKPKIIHQKEEFKLGREAFYANVIFPKYPGTGVTVYSKDGSKKNPDADIHMLLVPIKDLNLNQRNLKIEYLLITTAMIEITHLEEGKHYHDDFIERISLLKKPAFNTGIVFYSEKGKRPLITDRLNIEIISEGQKIKEQMLQWDADTVIPLEVGTYTVNTFYLYKAMSRRIYETSTKVRVDQNKLTHYTFELPFFVTSKPKVIIEQ